MSARIAFGNTARTDGVGEGRRRGGDRSGADAAGNRAHQPVRERQPVVEIRAAAWASAMPAYCWYASVAP